VIVKFGTGSALINFSGGKLSAGGTSSSPIVFTSLADDSVGGDTGGDGPTTGAAGQWCDLAFTNSGNFVGQASTLAYVTVSYAGKGGCGPAAINMITTTGNAGPNVTVLNSTITKSLAIGVANSGSALILEDSSVDHNGSDGIKVSGTNGYASINGSTISSNSGKGLNVQSLSSGSPATAVFDSTITGNAYGVYTLLSTSLPAASWPFGHRNNIYANGTTNDEKQLFDTNASPRGNWTNNYWGSDVNSTYNYSECGPPVGYLTYSSNTYPNQVGPVIHGSQWSIFHPLPQGSTHCFKDKTFIGPGEFSQAPFSGSPSVASAELLGMGSSVYANVGQEVIGEPVNPVTGNFSRAETDLSFPEAVGVPFSWARNYNGFQDLSSPLGPGWTGSWSDSLELLANGDINFRSANGGRFHYTLQSGGSYLGDAGVTATLASISGGYEVTRKDQFKLDFDSSGRLTSLKDRNSQGLTFSYTSGRLSTVTDSVGRTMSFTYNGGGQLTQVSSSDGRSVSYTYNSPGQLATDTDTRGKVWSYTYDTNGLLTKETDPRSKQVFKLVYDNYGRVTDRYDAFNDDTTFSYNFSTQTTTITDPLGKVIKDIYQNGALVERIDELNHATYRSYDSNLNVASTTDARGKVTTYTYDAAGNVLTKTAPSPLSYVQTWTYNGRNDVTSYVDGRNKTTTFGYDSTGNLTSITQPGSNVTSFAYDSGGKGLLVSTTDPRSKTTTFAYDSSNNRTSSTDPDGNVTSFGYDSIGRVASIVDARGNASGANPNDYKTVFTYDAAGRLLTKTDQLGNVTIYTYDDTGNKATFKNALNKTWTYAYDDGNELTSTTAPDSSTVTKTYTVRGELASATDQLGHKTSYTYDDAGQLASKVMPRGNVSGATPADYTWTYGYDPNGNQTSKTDPLGHATTYAYDALNRLSSVTDSLSHTTSFDYDANNNQTSATDSLSHTVSNAYDDLNRLVSTTDGRSKTTTYGYDAAGNRTSVTDPLGNQATFNYDDAGLMIASVDARGNASGANPNDFKKTYGYDEAGNRTTVTDPLSHATTFAFDRDGRLLSKTDPLSHSIAYGYDPVGRLQSVTAPDSSITSYGYDDLGNLTSRTDANLHTTAYGYDAAQRLTSITNPLGKVWNFSYDADDELTSRVDAIANAASNATLGTTTYSFDRVGRQTGVDYSDSTPDLTYGYDNANRLTSLSDGAGTKSYGYDNADRLTSISRGSASFSYSYDNANNLTQTTHPDSTSITYGYDNAERLSSMTQASNTTSYGYDEAGEITSKTLPNGIVESRSYDHAGQLSEISAVNGSTTMTDFQVTRDVAGNPTQVAKLGGAVETYGYDNFGRLADVCFQSSCPNGSDPKIAWTYDSIGRRQTETQPSGTHTYSYNAGDQVTSTTDGSTTTNYTYDADGRETAKGSSSFGYDMASNVTAATVGSTTTSYSYDGQGNRLSASDGTNTTNFLWDENTLNGLPQLARESDGSGNLIRRHLSDAEGASTLQTGAGSFYYLRDQAGSVAKLTDASANTEWSYAYEPFGATKTATKVDPSAPDNPLQFDGQYLDAGSGLYDLRARQYDPNDGRFLSTDPLAPGLTDPYISAYVYSNDQPTMLADPSGMSASSVVGTIMWRATRQAFDGVVRIVNGVGHLMSIGIHVCEMATPWGVLKHLCAPILITVVAFATLSPEALFASESEGLLSTIASREGYESRNIGQWARGILSRFWSKERRSLGGERVAVEEEAAIVNGAGRAYPRVLDPRTGEPIRAPESGLIKVPVADRAAWGAQERAAFIKEWYKRGYSTPEGGWPKYDIHHITPREYGGTNDFNNLVPVLRGTHQQEFNAWWRDYP
jgi:RHS repeat-associated protein